MNKPRSFEKLWRKRFENFAAQAEDDAGIAGWSPTGLDARLRKFKEIWYSNDQFSSKKKWLDAGCGAGTYSRFIVKQGGEVVGLDYSLPSLQKARLKIFGRHVLPIILTKSFPLPDIFRKEY